MNTIALIALAFAMSMDAFAAAIVQGTHKRTVSIATALKVGGNFWHYRNANADGGLFCGAICPRFCASL